MSPVALALLGVLALHATLVAAQTPQAPRGARVGVLAGGGDLFRAGLESFRQRLRELGYTEDQNLALFVRAAENRAERFPELAAELVQLKVDVIVVQGNAALTALKPASPTIPIVMARSATPSAPASWRAWPGRAATSPGSPTWPKESPTSGWSS